MKKRLEAIKRSLNNNIDADRIVLLLDVLFLAALFFHFVIWTFKTSMMEQELLNRLLDYSRSILYSISLVRFISKNRENKGFIFKALIFSLIFFISSQISTYKYIFDYAVIAIGLKDIDIKYVLKVYLAALIPSVLIVMYLCYKGSIQNIIYTPVSVDRVRVAYGFISPTDFAAHLSFAYAAWLVLCKDKKKTVNVLLGVLLLAFVHFKVDARTSEITILGLIIICLLTLIPKNKVDNIIGRPVKWLKNILCFSPVIFMSFMLWLIRFYINNSESEKMIKLNLMLSKRLMIGVKNFSDFDLSLFGRYCKMVGNGGLLYSPKDYTFVDCSYFNALFKYGIISLILILIIVISLLYKNRDNTIFFFALVLICAASMMEHHLMEYHYNIFMLLIFCTDNKTDKRQVTKKAYEECFLRSIKNVRECILAGVIISVFYKILRNISAYKLGVTFGNGLLKFVLLGIVLGVIIYPVFVFAKCTLSKSCDDSGTADDQKHNENVSCDGN